MARSPQNQNRNDKDQSLVAEQGGFSTSLIGLTIAVVLGLLVRGALAPDKIKSRINEAVQRIGGDLKVSFDQAYISLSRGVLPDLALVIKNAHLESAKKCWLSPDADINELRFPISVFDAIAGKSFVHKVEVDRVVLLLRTDAGGCEEGRLPSSESLISSVPSQDAEEKNSKARTAGATPILQPDIRSLSINRLKVNYLPIPFTSLEFVDFDTDVDSLEPMVFHITTGLDLGGETLSGDYSSHAKIELDYDQRADQKADQKAQPALTGTVHGSWREGRYELKVQHDPSTAELAVSGEVNHLPLSQIFPLLKKYKVMIADFNGKQTWVSSRFSAQGKSNDLRHFPLTLQDLKLEGDLGEVMLARTEITSWSPVQFEPAVFKLKDVDLDKVLVLFNRPHPTQAFGKLGTFAGEAVLSANHAVQVKGQHQKLEIIFSNKGFREVQQVENFAVHLKYEDEKWSGEAGDIHLLGGEANGKINFASDRDWRNLNVNVELDALTFSQRVQQLMTQGGRLITFSLRRRREC